MKTYAVPHTSLEVSSVILGLMRIADMSDADIRALFDAALDSGITVFDHADVYGGTLHRCEERFGAALKLSAADRSRIILQSKVGIGKGFFDFSRERILKNVDGTLAALKTEPPRVYRRVICSTTRRPYRVSSGLHRTPPLL